MSSRSAAGNTVPIAVRKQLVATWVETKQLLRQQIGSTMDAVDKVPFFLGHVRPLRSSMTTGYRLHVAGPQTQMMLFGLISGWTQHAWNPQPAATIKQLLPPADKRVSCSWFH